MLPRRYLSAPLVVTHPFTPQVVQRLPVAPLRSQCAFPSALSLCEYLVPLHPQFISRYLVDTMFYLFQYSLLITTIQGILPQRSYL